MPVIPEYRPTQAPGSNVRDFLGAYAGMSSLMERKQRLAMAQEDQAMEREKFEAFKPAIVAKAQADLTSAAAAIANTTRMEALRAQAAQSSTDYNDRFLNIMSIADDKERSDTLGAFMGEVSWLDNPAIPEYQGFARAVKDERAKAFTMAATNLKLDQHLEELIATNATKRAIADTAAAAKAGVAETYTASRERIKQIDADTKLTVEDKRAQRSAIQLQALQQQALDNDQMAADAQAEGNTQLAATYRQQAANTRDAIEKTTTFAGTGSSAPRTAAQDPKPTPKTTFSLPPLTLGGKTLAAEDAAPVRKAVQEAVVKPVKGTRAKQGGVWYQFDGSTWNAEKP